MLWNLLRNATGCVRVLVIDVLGVLLPTLVDAVQSIKQSIKRQRWTLQLRLL